MVGVLLISAWLEIMAAAVLELVEHDVVAMGGAVLLAVAFDLLLVLILYGVRVAIYNFQRPSDHALWATVNICWQTGLKLTPSLI